MIRDYLAMLLPYALGVLGGLIMGIPIGRIQGAERVKRGCCEREGEAWVRSLAGAPKFDPEKHPPIPEPADRLPRMTRAQLNAVTAIACRGCWKAVADCKCPMRARRGRA